MCCLEMHVSPIIVNPSGNLCANGSLSGPMRCSMTWCTWGRSLPISSRIFLEVSIGEMLLAMSRMWVCCNATSGVGISRLLFGISSHSKIHGNCSLVSPSADTINNPEAVLQKVVTCPEHDVIWYCIVSVWMFCLLAHCSLLGVYPSLECVWWLLLNTVGHFIIHETRVIFYPAQLLTKSTKMLNGGETALFAILYFIAWPVHCSWKEYGSFVTIVFIPTEESR